MATIRQTTAAEIGGATQRRRETTVRELTPLGCRCARFRRLPGHFAWRLLRRLGHMSEHLPSRFSFWTEWSCTIGAPRATATVKNPQKLGNIDVFSGPCIVVRPNIFVCHTPPHRCQAARGDRVSCAPPATPRRPGFTEGIASQSASRYER